MSSCYDPLIPAVLELHPDGRPVSSQFDDVYYSGERPLLQARDVFIQGNQLPGRWRRQHQFTVLETGFGLGHNFLALWQAWRDDPERCERLHFVSIEAHPFTQKDLSVLLSNLDGDVRHLGQALVQAWPPLAPGIHRLEFDAGAVTLTLAFGRIERVARQLEAGFDACFLDGFAPRVNPEMWTSEVFRQLARLANQDATLATWCSAGHVRRGLQDAGFLIAREPGFGTKRHRITGRLRPNMGRFKEHPRERRVMVIGSGFAGAAAAYSMAVRGQEVMVFDPALAAGAAGTHSGHRAAAMTPALSRDDDVRTRLSRTGVLLALLRWRHLPEAARPVRCGTFEAVPVQDQDIWQRALDFLQLPRSWVCWLNAHYASRRTGASVATAGIWHHYGHQIQPGPLLTGLLGHRNIVCRASLVDRLSRDDNGLWTAHDACGTALAKADVVVLANSWLAGRLLGTIPGLVLPRRLHSLHRVAGQLSYFSRPSKHGLRSILDGNGLCLPDGVQGLVGGSTYVSGATLSIITKQGHHENRQKVADLLGIQPKQLGWPCNMVDGWAGWRAAVRDRLPVIGPVAATPGLWLACGFGSRGLTWSALGAELLAATLNQEPIPLERELLKKIAPL